MNERDNATVATFHNFIRGLDRTTPQELAERIGLDETDQEVRRMYVAAGAVACALQLMPPEAIVALEAAGREGVNGVAVP